MIKGDFKETVNYECYNDSDECIEKAIYLLSNTQKVHNIENNNIEYYNKYLRPDSLVLNTLNIALNNRIILD